MIKIVACLALFAATLALPVQVEQQEQNYFWFEFGKYSAAFNKNYNSADLFHGAFDNFKANLQMINAHNAKSSSYKLSLNEFSDLSLAEFLKTHTGFKASAHKAIAPERHAVAAPAPAARDWRSIPNVVGPVKDQGQCGSCWAFSAIASLEGAHALKAAAHATLSEQQLVDCSTSFGNMGCNGGLMDQAFQYLINATKGEDTSDAYPYTAVDGTCSYKADKVGATIKSFADVTAADEAALLNAVGTVGPVSVAIQVVDDFMYYSGGIYDSSDCSSAPETLNHGVTVVGYGTEGKQDYWIVRNSWGSSWGEAGYIRMARGKNICGIADVASYPIV